MAVTSDKISMTWTYILSITISISLLSRETVAKATYPYLRMTYAI